jgi:hypothetical protein
MQLSNLQEKSLIYAMALVVSIGIIMADLGAGPFVRLPVLFAFPIILVSWCCGFLAGQSMAIGLPLLRIAIESGVPKPWKMVDTIVNTTVLVLAFSLLAFLVSYVQLQRRRIRVLQGLLPICSYCKKIRTETGRWEQMETYISQHSAAHFSHGVCPVCAKREYNEDAES